MILFIFYNTCALPYMENECSKKIGFVVCCLFVVGAYVGQQNIYERI